MRLRPLLTLFCLFPFAVEAAVVDVTVTEPAGVRRKQWPVTSGIPFKQGALKKGEQSRLTTREGREIPLQTEVLSRWPDGSVKWLLLDFAIDLKPRETRRLSLHYGGNVRRSRVAGAVSATKSADGVTLRTGRICVKLSAKSFRLLDAVWIDRNRDGRYSDVERLTANRGAGIELKTPDGRSYRSDFSDARLTIEQSGPMRACVRIEGRHGSKSETMYRYIVRIHAYRNSAALRLHYTFINDHTAKVMSQIDSLDLVFASANPKAVGAIDGIPESGSRLLQVDDRRFQVDRKNAGKRAAGWCAIPANRGGFAVGVRNFWQNWPKGLAAKPGELRVGICPQFSKGLYDSRPLKEECKLTYYLRNGVYTFKVGAARTHELWVKFFDGETKTDSLARFFRAADHPLLAQCKPRYVSETRAIGIVPPVDPKRYAKYDLWLDRLFAQHLADRERVREYGLLNFGDWYNVRWDSWGNLEYDTARSFFTQYLRSGDRRYFDRAAQAARHFIDVDILHATNKEVQAFGGSHKATPGHIWAHTVGHTGGYYGRYVNGRYVKEAPLIMKGPYQVGMMDNGHVWIGGVFDYYHLTGDRRALDVATLAADNLAKRCPTRYSDHIRGVGWPLHMMLAAYESTGKKRYLAAATRQWRLLKKHLDPKKGWVVMLAYGHCNARSTAKRCRGQNAYMLALTLGGLARYHRITKDPAVLKALSIGLDQLIRESWSGKHRSFYLTSCTHARGNPPPALCAVTALAAEAFAWEYSQTGNKEHRRVFREAFRTLTEAGLLAVGRREQAGQTGYASMVFLFAPYGLPLLER